MIDAEAIAAGKQLKVIARAGVGLDNVDIKTATEAGVMVVNAPTSNVVSAAELAIGHLLALARHIPDANHSAKAGEWMRSKFTGVELYEKTIGIVGLGRIGTLVAQRLAGFGAELVAYDPYVTPARAQQLGVTMLGLDELMSIQRLRHHPHSEDPGDDRADRHRPVRDRETDACASSTRAAAGSSTRTPSTPP